MSGSCTIPHPLKREGTYQWQRLPAGLKKDFYKPDDRSLEQLVKQVAQYASYIKFYDTSLNEWGNWEAFFHYLYDYPAKKLKYSNIDALLQSQQTPPHLGLMLSFLKNFQVVRDQFNGFTGRHLHFYYHDVLRLSPKPATPDKAAVLLEPEKNTSQAIVEAGRELNAGKDKSESPKDLVYKITREIIVNQALVTEKKTIYADKNTSGGINALHIARNAVDENKLVQNNITGWYPFGNKQNQKAETGFAVCSPMFFAKEGRRRLSIEIEGGASLPRTSLTAWFTGPKGWVQAEVDIYPGINYNSSAVSRRFLLVKIDESLPAIAAYDEKVHKSGFSCTYPVVKLLLKNDANFPAAFDFFSGLPASAIKKMVMNVEGSKSFTLSGENGKLNPLQPFKPFGNQPVKNKSFCVIGCKEAFNKYLSTFHLAINWKGAPGNMTKYYSAYSEYLKTEAAKKNTANESSISTTTLNTFAGQWPAFDQGNVPGKAELLSGGQWKKVEEDKNTHYITRKAGAYNTFHTDGVIKDEYETGSGNDYSESSRWGFAKITLKYDFGHQIFPLVLSYTVTKNALGNAADVKPVPPQPYTPEFNSLHLDYVLEDTINFSAGTEHQFIQLHPFGFSNIVSAQQLLLAADYRDNGQLYIGISGCAVPQTINLYIARMDGTEDIDALINEKIKWFYLSGAAWLPFEFEEITVNTTHDFTSAGFISFAIPDAALLPNTVMGENRVWIKAVSPTSATAYPAILDIHTNAAEAVFDDRGNDPYHLQASLAAGSIAKPLIKIEGVKSVSQPYASYGGSMAEQEEQFNTRISERLRHKNRNWTIWDYEHQVLEKFPSIYKLKCISHADADSLFAPGYVLCVALPATANIAEKDLLQPRVSKATLTAAAEYCKLFMTPFAHAAFINPMYEPITVKCSVKIKPGFDENYYAGQLNKDLQAFISPWLLNKNSSPSFGGRLYASGIINFIEERSYIDYLTFFEAFKLEEGKNINWKEYTAGSTEAVILTSALQHEIDTNATC